MGAPVRSALRAEEQGRVEHLTVKAVGKIGHVCHEHHLYALFQQRCHHLARYL